jgi:hypothetical protein
VTAVTATEAGAWHAAWAVDTPVAAEAGRSSSPNLRGPARAHVLTSLQVEMELTGRAACKSMSRAQEHLAQANGHIAELKVRIVRQRVIVKYALDTGQRSEMAESLLDALEGSLRLFEKHRIFLLSCSGSSSASVAARAGQTQSLAI